MPDKLKRFAREGGEPERRHVADRRAEGWHEGLKEELDAHAERIESRLRRFYSRALGAFAVMGIASAVALVGFGIVLDSQKQTTASIQNQRLQAILENCLDTNVRHDNALDKIDAAAAKAPKRQRDPRAIAAFKAIIEATVPYTTDCRVFARDRLRGG